jgi:tRNA-dihydrouridine synthase
VIVIRTLRNKKSKNPVEVLATYLAILLTHFKELKDVTKHVSYILKQRLSRKEYEEAMNTLNNVAKLIERKWLRRELAEELEYRLYNILEDLFTLMVGRADSLN